MFTCQEDLIDKKNKYTGERCSGSSCEILERLGGGGSKKLDKPWLGCSFLGWLEPRPDRPGLYA